MENNSKCAKTITIEQNIYEEKIQDFFQIFVLRVRLLSEKIGRKL